MKQNSSVEAYLDDYRSLTVEVFRRYYNGVCEQFYIKEINGKMIHCQIRSTEEFDLFRRYNLVLDEELEFHKEYELVVNQGFRTPVQFRYIVQTEQFDRDFYYDQDDLGAVVLEETTSFALWAPTATSVNLCCILEDQTVIYAMHRSDKGVWRQTLNQNCNGMRYTYYVSINGEIFETIDPYGKSSDCNGRHSVVVDLESLMQENTSYVSLTQPTDAIIYECSIRDMTSMEDSGSTYPKSYLGMIEKNTQCEGHKTGFDYLCDLGISHVQLMPVCDFFTVDESFKNNQYNWGYDPFQLMTFEGSFSQNPHDGLCRVHEMMMLVNAFHRENIGVILDVVFNHHYDVSLSSFERCVPYYYFRYNENHTLSNGSYCGNDLESRRAMVRKIIVDTCSYFAKVYHVDGFRFDLMGIMDVETLHQVEESVRALNPSALIYGEGWNMPTALPDIEKSTLNNQAQLPQVYFFNDYYRDHIKGKSSEFEKYHRGYMTGDVAMIEAAKYCLCAMAHPDFYHLFENPIQSINYLECHDNATLWDKMRYCCNDEVREIRMERQKLCMAALLFSQGIPFIHAGQEFCRTKSGYDNTYNMPDAINQIDWKRKNRNIDVVNFTKDCIALRKKYVAFRLVSAAQLKENVSFDEIHGVLVYRLKAVDNDPEITVYFNPFKENLTIAQDQSTCVFDAQGLCHTKADSYRIPAYSCLVLVKSEI